MAQRDVEIRIRARDEASANAKKISDSLKKIGVDAKAVASDVGAAGHAMGELASDVARLQQDAGRLTALGKLASQIDKAGTAADRAQRGIAAAGAEFRSYRQEHERAATAVGALTSKLASEKSALDANGAALKAAREQRALANREAQKAITLERKLSEAQTPRVRRGIGVEAGAPASSARSSAQVFFQPEIASAKASQVQAAANVERLAEQTKELRAAVADTSAELTGASRDLRRFETSTERAGNALLAARTDAAQTQSRLASLRGEAVNAAAALGNIEATQDGIGRAAQRNAAELQKVQVALAAYQKFSTGSGDFADPKTASTLRAQNVVIAEAKADLAALREEAARLAVEMKNTSGNVTKQVTAFNGMAAAVRAADAEVQRQIGTMNRLRGVTQSSFGAWARANVPLQQAATASRALGDATDASKRGLDRLRPSVQGVGSAAGQAAKQTGLFSKSILSLGSDGRQALSYMQRMRGEALALSASFIGLYAAIEHGRGALNAFRTVEGLQSRLGAAFQQNTTRVGQEITWLRSEADRLAVSFGTMADQYGKFSVATTSAGMSARSTREVFSALAESGRVNKLSADQMAGAFLALEQIVSKGKFTAEEVRGQLGERLPGAFSILSAALGVTTAELDKMMEAGEVLASEENLLKFAKELQRRFGPQLSASLNSVSADLARFENDVFTARLALANGFIPELRKALQAFNAFANSADGSNAFTAIGEMAGNFVEILAEIPRWFEEIKVAVAAFASIKLAGLLLEIGSEARKATSGFATMGRSVLVTAGQMRQMNAVEKTMAVSFNRTIGTLTRHRAALLSSASASGALTLQNRILIASLTATRATAAALALTVRTLYAAFGGLPGIIATGLSVALIGWATSTDKATAALTEHKRILDRVREGYQQVGDKADDWAKKIKNVTLSQAVASAEKLRESYDDIADTMADIAAHGEFAYIDIMKGAPNDARGIQAKIIAETTRQLRKGAISLDDYRAGLDAIAQSPADEELGKLALRLLDMVSGTEEGGEGLQDLADEMERAEAAIRLMNGTATDADKTLLNIGGAAESVGRKMRSSVDPMKAYHEALKEIKSLIPSLADDMERLEKVTKLTANSWVAFTSAIRAGDIGAAMEALNLGLKGLGEIGYAQQDSRMDAYLGDGLDDYIKRTIYVEGGQSGSGPSTSSARGIGQFTEGTWLGLFNRVFPLLKDLNDTEKLALRTSDKHATEMLKAFSRDNAAALERRNLDVNRGNLYLSHFLGSGDAIKVLLANPDALADSIVSADSVKANPSVFTQGLTAGDLIGWAHRKMGGSAPVASGGATQRELDQQESYKAQAEAMGEAFKKSQEQAKATKERIDDLDHQIAQQKLINAEKGREAAIENAIRDARKENPRISDAELTRIKEQTAALYDQQNAREGLTLAEEKVNQLYELRQQLLEQMSMAKEAGNLELMANLKNQVAGIDEQLTGAISKAIAMWQAIGGTEADAAIAKLSTMQMSLQNNADQMVAFGLNVQQVGSLTSSLVDGLISIFDAFAQAVANGENAIKAMGVAFLQFAADFLMQIGQMILRQMLLNALASFAGGPGAMGSIGNAAVGLGGIAGHTGGKVGSVAIGGGNRIGSFGQQYRHALVMHEGGMVGLKPNEVNATLKVGEEVLTEENPRHISNQGGETGAGNDRGIKQVLAMGDDEIANALNGSAGERVILTMLKRNRATIRMMLG